MLIKLRNSLLFLFTFLLVVFSIAPGQVSAQGSCASYLNHVGQMPNPAINDTEFTLRLSGNNSANSIQPNSVYTFRSTLTRGRLGSDIGQGQADANRIITFSTTDPDAFAPGTHYLTIEGPGIPVCIFHEYTVNDSYSCGSYYINQVRDYGDAAGKQVCYGGANIGNQCIDPNFDVSVKINGLKIGSAPYQGNVDIKLGATNSRTVTTDAAGNAPVVNFSLSSAGQYKITVEKKVSFGVDWNFCKINFTAGTPGGCKGVCETTDPGLNAGGAGLAGITQFELCDQIADSTQKANCTTCYHDKNGVWTAIGCIGKDPVNIATSLVNLGLGIGGGIALLMILAAGFQFSISQGDPNKTKQAKELLTAAITGLLFIIFSVMILQFIGYDLLHLPGFGI